MGLDHVVLRDELWVELVETGGKTMCVDVVVVWNAVLCTDAVEPLEDGELMRLDVVVWPDVLDMLDDVGRLWLDVALREDVESGALEDVLDMVSVGVPALEVLETWELVTRVDDADEVGTLLLELDEVDSMVDEDEGQLMTLAASAEPPVLL